MKSIYILMPLICLGLAGPAVADPHKNESGHGKHKYKHEFRDGDCKAGHKYKKGKHKRKCRGVAHRDSHRGHSHRGHSHRGHPHRGHAHRDSHRHSRRRHHDDAIVLGPRGILIDGPSFEIRPPRVLVD